MDTKEMLQFRKQLNQISSGLPESMQRFLLVDKEQLSLSTRVAYAKDFRIFINYLSKVKKLPEVTDEVITVLSKQDIRNYLLAPSRFADGRPVFPTEARYQRKLFSLNTFWNYLYRSHLISTEMDLLSLSKTAGQNRSQLTPEYFRYVASQIDSILTISAAEASPIQRKFMKVNQSRNQAILDILLYTGLSVQEICDLKIGDIETDPLSLIVRGRNTNRYAQVIIPDEIQMNFLTYYYSQSSNPDLYLFPSTHSDKIHQDTIRRFLQTLKYTPSLTPAKCRKIFGMKIRELSDNENLVQYLLGNKSSVVSENYYIPILKKLSYRN